MKAKLLILSLLAFTISVFAQYPEVKIKDIQFQDPAGLNTYFDDDMEPSLVNDTVTITGVVMVPPYKSANPDSGALMYMGGGAAGFYLQDTSDADWGGITVRQTPVSAPFNTLDSGFVVKITGVVNEYSTLTQKTTQFDVIEFLPQNVVGQMVRPKPVLLTLDSLKVLGTDAPKAISEKWEGVYVEIRNVITFDRTASGGFKIKDGNDLTLNIGTKSNYYYNFAAPLDGTGLEYIRGYIETRSVGSGGLTLNPGFRSDTKIGSFPPSISTIRRNLGVVGYGQPVTITANISDFDGSVTDAKLIYHVNGGAAVEAQMALTSGVEWSATLPAQNDSSLVDYYIKATDNSNNVSIAPADTNRSKYFYIVLNRPVKISDVQYSPFGGGYSAYQGYSVTVSGTVSSDTSDGSTEGLGVYMQDGVQPWSGIKLFGTETLHLVKGDNVTVTGTVAESYDVTQVGGLNTPATIVVNSSGNTIPEPVLVSTADFGGKTNGQVVAEKWEAMQVKFDNIIVTDENADGEPGPISYNYGEMLIADTSAVNMRMEMQAGHFDYHNYWAEYLLLLPNNISVHVGDTFSSISGIMYYSYGNYKLLPRTNADFVGYISDVDEVNNSVKDFNLAQNYPNPFNPSTIISYSVPVEGLVTIKVFNVLGQEVATLVNSVKNTGSYKVNFDASRLTSGVYIYQINAGSFTNSKKMMLIK